MITTAKRNGAKRISVIIPYFSYGTQDKNKTNLASDVAFLLERSGVDHIVMVESHSEQALGFFTPDVCCEAIKTYGSGIPEMMKYSTEIFDLSENICIVSPDARGIWRSKEFKDDFIKMRRKLNRDLGNDLTKEKLPSNAVVYKDSDGSSVKVSVIGDVRNHTCIIVDDILFTGETILEAVKMMKLNHCKKIIVYVTHCNLKLEEFERILESGIDKL